MNSCNYICSWDLETNSTDWTTGEVVQIAAIMIDPHTLEFVEGSEFNSLVRPVNIFTGTEIEIQTKWNKCWGAWDVNKKTRKELEKAPLPEHTWKAFADYVKKYNVKGYNGKPIPAGHNIQGFDMLWLADACKKYKLADKTGKQQIFNTRVMLDTLNLGFLWWDHIPDTPEGLSMDVIRPYLGVSNEGFHDGMADCRFTGELLIRFLRLHRHYGPKVKFKNSFAKTGDNK